MWQLLFTYIALYPEWHHQIFFFDKRPMVLTDMVMLKWLGFTKWNSSIMDKPHSLNVATKAKHIKKLGKKGVGGQKLWPWWWEPIPHHQPEKAFHFFELSTGAIGSNHSVALTELFMPFSRVGQLYYGLANLLKVCASNLILDTCNLRFRKIIYSA